MMRDFGGGNIVRARHLPGTRLKWSPKIVTSQVVPFRRPAAAALGRSTFKDYLITVLALLENCQCKDRLFRPIIVLLGEGLKNAAQHVDWNYFNLHFCFALKANLHYSINAWIEYLE
jgi:hypothetical protein